MGNILKKISRLYNSEKSKNKIEDHGLELKDILESITDGFFAVDRQWIVRYYNRAAEKILLPRELIINKNLWDVFKDAVGSKFYLEYHKVMDEGVSSSFEDYYPSLDIWVQIQAYPSTNGITIYCKDITESKRQTTLETLEKDVLAHYTGKGSTIESSIQLLLEGIRQIHPDLLCSVLKVEDQRLKYFAFSHLPPSFIEVTDNVEVNRCSGCLGTEALAGEKTFSVNIANDPAWDTHRSLALDNQLNACVFYPLIDPWQKVIGLFSIFLNTPRALHQAEETTLQKSKYLLAHILQNHIAEETLKISEGKYRDLFYLHPLPLWLYDVETYKFLDVNEAAIRHYGYSREEFLGMTIRDIRLSEDVKHLEDILSFTKTSGAYSTGMFRHRKKSGELIHVEVKSNSIDFYGSKARLILSNDITAKVEIERALNLSEKRFKAMVQEGSDLINILDPEGAYIYASPASAAMFGKQPEEVIGSHAMHSIHEEDQGMLGLALAEIRSTRRLQTKPYRFRMPDGEYRWLQSIGTNLLDDPAVKGIVINSKDITDSVDYIHAIEKQNARLRDIAWTQSHVVRAPLSRIMGLIDLIKLSPENNQLHSELIEHVLSSAYELDRVIREIIGKTEQAG